MVGTRTPGTPPVGRSAAGLLCAAAGAGAAPHAEASMASAAHRTATRDRSMRRGPHRVRRSDERWVVPGVRMGCLRGECPPPAARTVLVGPDPRLSGAFDAPHVPKLIDGRTGLAVGP